MQGKGLDGVCAALACRPNAISARLIFLAPTAIAPRAVCPGHVFRSRLLLHCGVIRACLLPCALLPVLCAFRAQRCPTSKTQHRKARAYVDTTRPLLLEARQRQPTAASELPLISPLSTTTSNIYTYSYRTSISTIFERKPDRSFSTSLERRSRKRTGFKTYFYNIINL
jgi:hypothetical protein